MKKLIITIAITTLSIGQILAQFGPPGGGMGRPMGDGNSRPRTQTPTTPTLDLDGNAPKGNSKITGIVVDEDLKSAVEFANVALYSKVTKKPVDGGMADEKGQFTLKKVAAGDFYLQVSFIGFETKTIADIKVEKGKDIDLGVIKLKQSTKQLDELVVTGQAAMIEEKVDRLVYNAEKDLSSRGGDAADVLKNVPMLSVDLDGNVSLRGSANIRVLINNKPSTIVASSVADALKMLPAELIKSVEVITSPSAKYDAEGSAGIINIITKKSTLQGLNLNLDSGVGVRASNLGLNGNYRQGKLGISFGGFGRAMYNKSDSESEQNIFNLDPTKNVTTLQTQTGKNNGLFGRYNLGFDYDLAKNQSLSAGLAFGTRNFGRDQLLYSKSTGATNSEIWRDVNSNDNSHSVDANLDYIRTFKPGQEWSISTMYSQNKLINNFTSDFLTGVDGELLRTQQNINHNLNTEITLQTDYVTPIGKKQQIEFGIKGVMRGVDSDYEYLFGLPGSTPVSDAKNPAGFLNYAQNVYSGYVSYLFTTKNRINFKLGTRYERTQITADDPKGNIVIPAYDNLVPSINISKTIKTSTYKIAYNRRIQRPGLQQLNPNVNLANPLNISYGNSSLSPELTDNFELSLSKSIKKTYLTTALFFRNSGNSINRITTPSDSIPGGVETTFENIGKEQSYGTNIFGNVFLGTNWTLNGGFDIMYRYMEGQQSGLDGLSQKVSNDGWVISGRAMTNLKLKNGWAFQAGGGMRGKQVNLQGTQSGMGMYQIGFRKDFGKKASLGLAAENFVKGMTMRNTTSTPTIYSKSTNYMYNSNVKLTFSYKLGNMRFVEQKTKKVKNDDVKSGGDDN